MSRFDVIIVGLGAMGSAAAFHLARRGVKVLGLDRFAPPHAFGSSHGQTRIIREAYFEHPLYVPLIRRAYELWSELESLGSRRLLHRTGGLMIGPPESAVVTGALQSARAHALHFEVLEASQARSRFPALRPAEGMVAVWEPRAGILFPEACIESHLGLARQRGADLRTGEPAVEWAAAADGVRVRTGKGQYHAEQVLLSAGSWIVPLLGDLAVPLTVERQVQYWFEPSSNAERFRPEHCPIHIWEYEPGRYFYGFPNLGDGVKVARHHQGLATTPDSINRDVEAFEVDEMRMIVDRFLPGANGPLRSAVVCQYTNTPDLHFWIDRHPEHQQVLIASACSGHGFKFSSVIGETLADLLVERRSRFDLSLFTNRSLSGSISTRVT